MPTAVPESEIRAALDAADKIARRLAPTQALSELASDKATDAILRALRSYDPSRGPFAAYARSFSWLAITAALRKPLPRAARRLSDANETNNTPDVPCQPVEPDSWYAVLPDPLRVAAVLRFCHGYSVTDTALLCGIDRQQLRDRLASAAEIILRVDP